jgi:hypothetical protein
MSFGILSWQLAVCSLQLNTDSAYCLLPTANFSHLPTAY